MQFLSKMLNTRWAKAFNFFFKTNDYYFEDLSNMIEMVYGSDGPSLTGSLCSNISSARQLQLSLNKVSFVKFMKCILLLELFFKYVAVIIFRRKRVYIS